MVGRILLIGTGPKLPPPVAVEALLLLAQQSIKYLSCLRTNPSVSSLLILIFTMLLEEIANNLG